MPASGQAKLINLRFIKDRKENIRETLGYQNSLWILILAGALLG